jgi:RNase adaptor protein for sRNA GlmZ degradation
MKKEKRKEDMGKGKVRMDMDNMDKRKIMEKWISIIKRMEKVWVKIIMKEVEMEVIVKKKKRRRKKDMEVKMK